MNCGFQVSSCLQPVWLLLLLMRKYFQSWGSWPCHVPSLQTPHIRKCECKNQERLSNCVFTFTCRESHQRWHQFYHHSSHLKKIWKFQLGSLPFYWTRYFLFEDSQPDINIRWSFFRFLWLGSRIRGGTWNWLINCRPIYKPVSNITYDAWYKMYDTWYAYRVNLSKTGVIDSDQFCKTTAVFCQDKSHRSKTDNGHYSTTRRQHYWHLHNCKFCWTVNLFKQNLPKKSGQRY